MKMVPQKLQQYFQTTGEVLSDDDLILSGRLCCCNSEEFEVHSNGIIKQRFLKRMVLHENNTEGLCFIAKCKRCNKTIEVFNSSTDGYDRCGTMSIAKESKTHLISCKKCNANDYAIEVKLEYSGISEISDTKHNDNAFSWIWVHLRCNKCGTVFRNVIDYETA